MHRLDKHEAAEFGIVRRLAHDKPCLIGCPFAVPEMKYSLASYLKVVRPFPGARDGVDSYIGPGPVIWADTDGNETAVGV